MSTVTSTAASSVTPTVTSSVASVAAPPTGEPAATPPAPPESSPHLLLRAAGGSFLALGFFGRLPAAMNQLGMLLIVSASGRGLALAGASVAAVGLGTAVGAPLVGRLVDRAGPVKVLAGAMALQICALLGVFTALHTGLPAASILALAAVLGFANPQAGSIARACWSGISRREADPHRGLRIVRVGLGFETAADETSYVVGPVAAGGLVTLCGAQGATLALLACTVLGEGAFALWLARHSAIARPAIHTHATGASTRTPWARLAPVCATIFAIGVVFGATQTALTAVHEAAGTPGLTGPIYGSMGVTSAIAGLIAPSIQRSVLGKTALGGVLIMGCSSVLMSVPPTPLTLALVLLMGAGVGTALATSYTRVEEAAPSGRVTTIMTVAATCNVLGVSAGSLATGALGSNLHHANLPAVIAGLLIILIAAAQVARRRAPRTAQA